MVSGVRPAVISMSLGGSGSDPGYSTVIDAAVENGVTVVVAAGNSNSDACNFSPAFAANAITVGSTDSTDRRSSFSNYGQCVEIWAPGSSVVSASSSSDTGLSPCLRCCSSGARSRPQQKLGQSPARVDGHCSDECHHRLAVWRHECTAVRGCRRCPAKPSNTPSPSLPRFGLSLWELGSPGLVLHVLRLHAAKLLRKLQVVESRMLLSACMARSGRCMESQENAGNGWV